MTFLYALHVLVQAVQTSFVQLLSGAKCLAQAALRYFRCSYSSIECQMFSSKENYLLITFGDSSALIVCCHRFAAVLLLQTLTVYNDS